MFYIYNKKYNIYLDLYLTIDVYTMFDCTDVHLFTKSYMYADYNIYMILFTNILKRYSSPQALADFSSLSHASTELT